MQGAHLFRIIRDTDIVIEEDEADDLLESVDRSLKQLRHGALSLLQVEADMPARVLDILVENFEVDDDVVVRTDAIGWASATGMQLTRAASARAEGPAVLAAQPVARRRGSRGDLRPDPLPGSAGPPPVRVVRDRSRRSCAPRCSDPHVVAIKMTLYRIGANSPLIDLLIEAAEAGKQVAVLVELKARFDERNNIVWATRLESHGIHVVYGFADLKTHCKLCLVVRQEADGIQRYAHIGTGNYNPATAKVYTDLGLFTADPEIVDDVSEVFNYLTGYSNQSEYRALLVAPVQLRTRHARADRARGRARARRPARRASSSRSTRSPTTR